MFRLGTVIFTLAAHNFSVAMPTSDEIAPPGSLARLWEHDILIRDRLRIWVDEDGKKAGGKLILWPEKNKSCSMQAIASNISLLKHLATWWCPTQTQPKVPTIRVLKKQAR